MKAVRLALWALFFQLLFANAVLSEELSGSYRGFGDAEGYSLMLKQVSFGYEGTLGYQGDRPARFFAEKTPAGTLTIIENAQAQALLRFSERSVGVLMEWIPLDDSGQMIVDKTLKYGFVPDDLPPFSELKDFWPPPTVKGQRVDVLGFLSSYQYWRPREVAMGYEGLRKKYRPLIRLFPLVQTDIVVKLCAAPEAGQILSEALFGQGISCSGIKEAVGEAQSSSGKFVAFKRDMNKQKTMLEEAVKCDKGILSQERCVRVSAWTAHAATSMDTVASILARYR